MKKIISWLLVFVLLFFCGVNKVLASTISNSTTVYIDGVEYNVKVLEDKITVTTVGINNDSTLEIYENGKAKMVLYTDENVFETYDITINELSEDKIDISYIDENNNLNTITDLSELDKDEYEGQIATTAAVFGTGITVVALGSFFKALLYTAVVYVSGVACYELSQAISNRKISTSKYYRAYRAYNRVYIGIFSISRTSAVNRLKSGGDTYTYYSSNAKSIVLSTGRGLYKTYGEIDSYSKYKKGVYYYHYHPKTGVRSHSFYGTAHRYNV